jgi:hypothetical protein
VRLSSDARRFWRAEARRPVAVAVVLMAIGLTVASAAPADAPRPYASTRCIVPLTNRGRPPASVVAAVGVLGEPRTASDKLDGQELMNADRGLSVRGLDDVYVNDIRFARSAVGSDWYVVLTGPHVNGILQPRVQCSAVTPATLAVSLYQVIRNAPLNQLGSVGPTIGGDTVKQIELDGMINGGESINGGRQLSGVVANGVATVKLYYARGVLTVHP